jgi:hypothetical protein
MEAKICFDGEVTEEWTTMNSKNESRRLYQSTEQQQQAAAFLLSFQMRQLIQSHQQTWLTG